MKNLHVLNLMGNLCIQKIDNYRRRMIIGCVSLYIFLPLVSCKLTIIILKNQ